MVDVLVNLMIGSGAEEEEKGSAFTVFSCIVIFPPQRRRSLLNCFAFSVRISYLALYKDKLLTYRVIRNADNVSRGLCSVKLSRQQ